VKVGVSNQRMASGNSGEQSRHMAAIVIGVVERALGAGLGEETRQMSVAVDAQELREDLLFPMGRCSTRMTRWCKHGDVLR